MLWRTIRWFFSSFSSLRFILRRPNRAWKGVVKTSAGVPGWRRPRSQSAILILLGSRRRWPMPLADSMFSAVEAANMSSSLKPRAFSPVNIGWFCVPRAVSLSIELAPRTTVRQSVEGDGRVPDDSTRPRPGSSQTFRFSTGALTRTRWWKTPSSLVANLMPGASQSHDNFINGRGNEFPCMNSSMAISFLDNTQPQFSPGASPQIFETLT